MASHRGSITEFYTWPCEIKQNVYPVNLSMTKKGGEVDYKVNIKINTQRDVDRGVLQKSTR